MTALLHKKKCTGLAFPFAFSPPHYEDEAKGPGRRTVPPVVRVAAAVAAGNSARGEGGVRGTAVVGRALVRADMTGGVVSPACPAGRALANRNVMCGARAGVWIKGHS